jgi:cobalt/nickel transport system permease protein
MHIPDGFLDAKTALASGALAACGVGLALRSARRSLPPSRVPLIGVASAFVFAAQMLNFPVAGGTSGHILGGVLAAVLLGPSAAVLALTSVLALQCFLFADGGVTALGANLFNMALVAPVVGYALYRLTSRLMGDTIRARLAGTAIGAWGSTMVAAIACAGELALSGTVPWGAASRAMALVHAPIGAGEAVITTLVVAAIARARPELLMGEGWAARETPGRLAGSPAREGRVGRAGTSELAAYGALVSLGLALFVAPFACPWPDGVTRVLSTLGVASGGGGAVAGPGPLRGYGVPGIGWPLLSTALAGGIGALLAFLLAYLLARRLTPGPAQEPRERL